MENIELAVDADGIARLALNRPQVLNALSRDLIAEMSAALDGLNSDEQVKALVLTGNGRCFCSGADLGAVGQEAGAGKSLGQMVSERMRDQFNPLMEKLYGFGKPVVVALNGLAAGGGAGIALCGDIVLAGKSAALKVVQVSTLGIVADLGANWLLPRLGGRARAMGACLLGDTLGAEKLLQWGLVWEVVEDDALQERALEVAARLAAVPAAAVLATRRLVDDATVRGFAETLEDERQWQEILCGDPVFTRAVAAFLSR